MYKYGIILIVLMLCLAIGTPCEAEQNALTKLGRGLNNTLTGWIEIPEGIYNTSRDENVFLGLTAGTVEGSSYCVVRTTAGALETGTFIFPKYDEPLMEPKYKF